MRNAIILLIVLLVAVVGYTAYGLMTFEPDPATPFTFAEPTLPADVASTAQQADGPAATGTNPVSPEAQQQQTDAAVAQLTQAVTLYQGYEKDATPQAVSTFAILNAAVYNGRLPAYLLSQTKDASGKRSFDLITLDPKKSQAIGSGATTLDCKSAPSSSDVMIGDNGDNQLVCEADARDTAFDRMILGGPGNDNIISSHGNRIINAGTGDDTITAGMGRTIIILDDAWGKDTLTVDCGDTKIDPATEIPANFAMPWLKPFTNFIVLSPRINPADVSWNGLVLTNKTTGDTLSVSDNCFNVISAGQASTQ